MYGQKIVFLWSKLLLQFAFHYILCRTKLQRSTTFWLQSILQPLEILDAVWRRESCSSAIWNERSIILKACQRRKKEAPLPRRVDSTTVTNSQSQPLPWFLVVLLYHPRRGFMWNEKMNKVAAISLYRHFGSYPQDLKMAKESGRFFNLPPVYSLRSNIGVGFSAQQVIGNPFECPTSTADKRFN